MAPINKETAQQRADRIAQFREELSELEREGVLMLEPSQQQTVSAHHANLLREYSQFFDVDRNRQAKQLSLGMRIASFLGALAMVASVFFLFLQFWGRFDTEVQVAILIGAALLSFAATLLVERWDASGYFVKLAALVAFACFVLNIALLGSLFNITPSDNALIVWAAYALLLAYALEVRLLLAAGLLCLIAFLSARMGTWIGIYWLHFGERPENFLLAGLLMFTVPWWISQTRFAGFAEIYRVFGLITILIPVLILANWGALSYLDLEQDSIEGGYQVAGFVISAGAIWLGLARHYGEVVNTGNVFFVIFLYTKFFDWWWEIMPKYLFFLVIGLTALLFLFLFMRVRRTSNVIATEGGNQ